MFRKCESRCLVLICYFVSCNFLGTFKLASAGPLCKRQRNVIVVVVIFVRWVFSWHMNYSIVSLMTHDRFCFCLIESIVKLHVGRMLNVYGCEFYVCRLRQVWYWLFVPFEHPLSEDSNLVDSASSHTLVSKIKPCMSKYKSLTLKLRTAHYISYSLFDSPLLLG